MLLQKMSVVQQSMLLVFVDQTDRPRMSQARYVALNGQPLELKFVLNLNQVSATLGSFAQIDMNFTQCKSVHSFPIQSFVVLTWNTRNLGQDCALIANYLVSKFPVRIHIYLDMLTQLLKQS